MRVPQQRNRRQALANCITFRTDENWTSRLRNRSLFPFIELHKNLDLTRKWNRPLDEYGHIRNLCHKQFNHWYRGLQRLLTPLRQVYMLIFHSFSSMSIIMQNKVWRTALFWLDATGGRALVEHESGLRNLMRNGGWRLACMGVFSRHEGCWENSWAWIRFYTPLH